MNCTVCRGDASSTDTYHKWQCQWDYVRLIIDDRKYIDLRQCKWLKIKVLFSNTKTKTMTAQHRGAASTQTKQTKIAQ